MRKIGGREMGRIAHDICHNIEGARHDGHLAHEINQGRFHAYCYKLDQHKRVARFWSEIVHKDTVSCLKWLQNFDR